MGIEDPKKPVAQPADREPTSSERSKWGGDLIGKGANTEDDKEDDGTIPETARKPY